jgi:hypothetical protein
MTTLQAINASASPEVQSNDNFETLSAAAIYGKRQPATTGLTWGYYGGLYNGNTIADGAVTLTDSADNYVVVLRSTGVVSVSTSSTNSLNPLYAKLYKVTAAGGVVTAVVDQRNDTNGLALGGSGTGVTIDTDGTLAANSDTVVASQKATKTYVDTKLAGLSWKTAVRVVTTANGTLATAFANGQTVDGVTLATGDRILLKDQTTAADRGIYTVNATGAPTRATDADSGAELVNATVFVSEGTANADTQWTCTTNAPITLGTTGLTFVQSGAGGVASNSVNVFTKNQSVAPGTVPSATGTYTPDASLSNNVQLTLTGNLTLAKSRAPHGARVD